MMVTLDGDEVLETLGWTEERLRQASDEEFDLYCTLKAVTGDERLWAALALFFDEIPAGRRAAAATRLRHDLEGSDYPALWLYILHRLERDTFARRLERELDRYREAAFDLLLRKIGERQAAGDGAQA
ncbi:MAG: hypothetical protein QJR08_08840 [Bacillota bacterium]|nr:hypothetical protein [Bacillota bacterium]